MSELTYRGSVNRWECDENDHMNVRFYVQRHVQALGGDPGEAVRYQHIRFHAESRIAVPQSGFRERLAGCTLTELRHSNTDEVMSTCIHGIDDGELDPTGLPEYAAPRGVPAAVPAHAELMSEQLEELGFQCIGAGVVLTEETDAQRRLLRHHYMGRISDSMPHLWSLLRPDAAITDEGGAVLEYRLTYHRALLEGDRFAIWSGVAEVSAKVQRFVHLMYNGDGALVATAQAAAVRMDLNTRKAKVLADRELALLRQRCIQAPV